MRLILFQVVVLALVLMIEVRGEKSIRADQSPQPLAVYGCTTHADEKGFAWRVCRIYDPETNKHFIAVGGIAQGVAEVTADGR